ncbi:hypothetical protein AAFO90_24530 [Phaeobacter sp. CAU 1743]
MEGKAMTLLQRTANTLIKHGLCDGYPDFSQRFCKRTPNFFYRQRFYGRDFPTDALLECLFKIREVNASYDRFATIFETEISELAKIEKELSEEIVKRLKLSDWRRAKYLASLLELP